MELFISALISGIVGLILGVLFQRPLLAAKEKISKWFRGIFFTSEFTPPTPNLFRLGNFESSWIVFDGDGEMTYTPETIRCLVNQNPIELPPEISQLKSEITKNEREKENKGLPYLWNGPLYALEIANIERTESNENIKVTFTFRPTDYYTFQATVMSLDHNLLSEPGNITIRKKYLQGHDFSEPITFLANGFGISLAIFTKDEKILLTRRSDYAGTRVGELDVSVVEGINPERDRSIKDPGPDLYRTAIFGAKEELGINLHPEIITFLGFGVDTEYYQWNMIGVATISQKAKDALENRTRGTGGKWETKKIEIIDAKPTKAFNYLKEQKIWSTGLITIYWGLVQKYGRRHIDSIVNKIFK